MRRRLFARLVPRVSRISIVALEPGDVLVAHMQFETMQQADLIRRWLLDAFPGRKVLVTDESASFSVLRSEASA